MEERQRDELQAGTRPEPARVRKPYRSPELIEWGTILDLTQGTKSVLQDIPKGGSKGV